MERARENCIQSLHINDKKDFNFMKQHQTGEKRYSSKSVLGCTMTSTSDVHLNSRTEQ